MPRRRITNTLITAALATSAALVVIAAAPALLRAAGIGDRIETAKPMLSPMHEPPPRKIEGFNFDDDDEDPRVELPGDEPMDPLEGPHRDHTREPAPRMALARSAVKLYDSPEDGGIVTAVAARGDRLMILREAGEWVLVAVAGAERPTIGWVKKSEIGVR